MLVTHRDPFILNVPGRSSSMGKDAQGREWQNGVLTGARLFNTERETHLPFAWCLPCSFSCHFYLLRPRVHEVTYMIRTFGKNKAAPSFLLGANCMQRAVLCIFSNAFYTRWLPLAGWETCLVQGNQLAK